MPFFTLVFLVFNYSVIKSGVLKIGSGGFNEVSKYALLVNNFSLSTFLYTIILSIYIGSGFIGKDIQNNQIYLILSVYHYRIKYVLSNWLSQVMLVFITILAIMFNFFTLGFALNISISYSDMANIFVRLVLNSLVLMTLTAVFSILLRGKGSMIAGIAGIVVYNMYIYLKIPIAEAKISLSESFRRLLCTLAPITEPLAPSLIGTEHIYERYMVLPYLIDNILIYQLLFCIVLVTIGAVTFKWRDI